MDALRSYIKPLLLFGVVAALTFVLLYFRSGDTNTSPPVIQPMTAETTERKTVYTGAWVQDFWDNATKTLRVDTLLDFQKKIGRKVAFANIYADWKYLTNKDLLDNLEEISTNGWTPIVSSNPSFVDGCKDSGDSLYKTIASGACDSFLASAGANLRDYGKPVFLRFAWEMNHPDMYWSVKRVGSTPADFVAAWQRFHKVVRAQGATNVIWVLSFNTSNANSTPYKELYPGDDYVDWVAIDGYNWGVGFSWSGWASFDGVFRKSYEELIAVSDKPLMLSEVNSATRGGDKASWLTNMLTEEVPRDYPAIQAIVFFNENKTGGEKVDWRIEISDAYIRAVNEGLENDVYAESYP